mgnify:CR=1 FL=1
MWVAFDFDTTIPKQPHGARGSGKTDEIRARCCQRYTLPGGFGPTCQSSLKASFSSALSDTSMPFAPNASASLTQSGLPPIFTDE